METTTPRADVAALLDKFGSVILSTKINRGDEYVCVDRGSLPAIATFLRDSLGYDYFVECVGVDYLTWKHERDLPGRFEVVYNLFSIKNNTRLFVKTCANDGETIPTLKHVWLGAEYPEREIQDLYGVIFEGNGPEVGQRFLLPDDWIGFPLRKDVGLGGEDVVFDLDTKGPAVEDLQRPHAGESWEGKTGSGDISGR